MEEGNKKKKFNFVPIIVFLLFVAAGFFGGIYIGKYIKNLHDSGIVLSKGKSFMYIGVFLIALYISAAIQIVIHEAGHLVFGLLTGYKFSSFRVGSLMWLKTDKGIKLKKFSLAGTAGQCLMLPPDLDQDGMIPYKLYNFGGAIFNLLTFIIFGALAWVLWNKSFCALILLEFALIGLLYAITNGVPIKMGEVDNDGHNAVSLGKNKAALKAFWLQLKLNELQAVQGLRLKEMPEDMFYMPGKKALKNSHISAIGVFYCNRLMDEMRFEDAKASMEQLINNCPNLIGLYKGLLNFDRIYCELVGENNNELIEKLYDDEAKKIEKQMKNYPGIMRTRYAYLLLHKKDKKKAEECKAAFEKMAKKYPHQCEIESERELMEYADKVYNCEDEVIDDPEMNKRVLNRYMNRMAKLFELYQEAGVLQGGYHVTAHELIKKAYPKMKDEHISIVTDYLREAEQYCEGYGQILANKSGVPGIPRSYEEECEEYVKKCRQQYSWLTHDTVIGVFYKVCWLSNR